MSEIHLNKFEKEKRVIELHFEKGQTIREIAKEVHMSFRDISNIIKTYEKKKEYQAKRDKNNQKGQIKKPLISTQSFKLFRDGEKLTDVAIELEIPAKRALRLWSQFLRLERMYECYEFYQVFQSQIPDILAIGSFIRENNVDTRNISSILKDAKDVSHLQSYYSNLKNEIGKSEQIKKNYIASQNQLPPMQPLPRYPSWNGYY